jgi:glycosyltransferase involved in cell wall biosynthesis
MKIFFLTSRVPFPTNTPAKIRAFNLIKGVALDHELTLCTFVENPEERQHLRELVPVCKRVLPLFPRKLSAFGSIGLFFQNLFSRKPLVFQKKWSGAVYEEIRAELNSGKYDLIHCEDLMMAQFIFDYTGVPKVLDINQYESLVYKRVALMSKGFFRRRLSRWQWRKMQRYENYIFKFMDILLVATKKDRVHLDHSSPGAWVEEIPNGLDSAFYSTEKISLANQQNILLPININGASDEDALVHFFTRIWPVIKRKRENARLYIVGKELHKNLKILEQHPDIIVNNRVEDIRPFVAKSNVVVVPHRKNGIASNYLLEALAMGKTVVATSASCKGLEVTHGKEIVIADDPGQFAQDVLQAMNNPELGQNLGRQARTFVEQNYDWKVISARLKQVYNSATGK